MRYSKENVMLSRQSALACINNGFQPIPIPFGEKAPKIRNWNNLRINEGEVPKYFNSPCINIGVLLGEPSRNLIDIDIDCVEAVALANKFLPDTNFVFGHWSKPLSHYGYIVDSPPKSTQFTDIDGDVLLEIRSTNTQTLFPPSIHPSGEQIRYFKDGSPGNISALKLLESVQLLAAATLLTRHWPKKGSRQNAALALSGGLLSLWGDESKVANFIYIVAKYAGDEEARKRVKATFATATKRAAHKNTTGWPTLKNIIGNDVVANLLRWIGAGNELISEVSSNQKFTFLSIDEFRNIEQPKWLIEGICTEGSLTLLYGNRGDGKTFVAIDMMLSIANGVEWAGHRTEPGPVAYIAAEGRSGLNSRFKAWEKEYSQSINNIHILPEAVQLTEIDDLIELENAINKLPVKPKLLVIDTMARCMAGKDENSVKDISLMIKGLDKIRKSGISILLIHHTGRDEKKERGSSALPGATDTIIKVKNNENVVEISCEKQKDYEEFKPILFAMKIIQLPDDPPNDSSCVLTPFDGNYFTQKEKSLSDDEFYILNKLNEPDAKDGKRSTDMKINFMKKTSKSGATYYRAQKKLTEIGFIETNGAGRYILTNKAIDTITIK